MSINVVVSSTAAGVSVSGGTSVAITVGSVEASVPVTVGGGIGPAGFLINPGTATNLFGTFQLAAGDGITISTSAAQFQIASYGTAAVSGLAPVQSVAGRVGNVVLQASDVTAGTFAVARIPTISYTALSNVPATFTPSAHTHSTTDVVSFTSAAAAAAPVQSVAGRTGAVSLAAGDVSGLASVATSGSFTSLQNIPATFSPAAHTHSTADIVGYSSLPAQSGKAGPLVTDGTAATWSTRYSVVDPVLVQGAGVTLTRDTTAGSITVGFSGGTSGIVVSSATPQPLGTASSGSSGDAARADHVHLMPSAADVGAAAASHSHDYVQILNGLTGTVTITGGAGVTVSTSSSSITIAAGGGGGTQEIYEYATIVSFPATGAAGRLYVSTDHQRIYRYDSSGVYVELGTSGGGGGTSLPPAPTSVAATAGNAEALVQWPASSVVLAAAGVTDYVVQYSSNSGSTWTTFSDGTSTDWYVTVTGLTNGTAYIFRVAGVNAAGQGPWSAPSNSVTPQV